MLLLQAVKEKQANKAENSALKTHLSVLETEKHMVSGLFVALNQTCIFLLDSSVGGVISSY